MKVDELFWTFLSKALIFPPTAMTINHHLMQGAIAAGHHSYSAIFHDTRLPVLRRQKFPFQSKSNHGTIPTGD
jgi:hypothetical protein